jgi:hypothetical protein
MKRAWLVYQAGLANVFVGEVSDDSTRVMQSTFRDCEMYVRGFRDAGYPVHVMHCDVAGDVAGRGWADGPGELFSESKGWVTA